MIDVSGLEEGVLKAIITECLSVRPGERPSFAEIFGKTSRVAHLFPREFRNDASIAQVLAKLDSMERAADHRHEGVLKSLTELTTGEHGCPKMIVLSPSAKAKTFSTVKELHLYFVCAYSHEAVGPVDTEGFLVAQPKEWVERWAATIALSLTLLRVGGRLACALSGLPIHHLVAQLGLDEATQTHLDLIMKFSSAAKEKLPAMIESLSHLGERQLPAELGSELEQRSQQGLLHFLESKHPGWKGRLPMTPARNKDGDVAWVHTKHKAAWEAFSAIGASGKLAVAGPLSPATLSLEGSSSSSSPQGVISRPSAALQRVSQRDPPPASPQPPLQQESEPASTPEAAVPPVGPFLVLAVLFEVTFFHKLLQGYRRGIPPFEILYDGCLCGLCGLGSFSNCMLRALPMPTAFCGVPLFGPDLIEVGWIGVVIPRWLVFALWFGPFSPVGWTYCITTTLYCCELIVLLVFGVFLCGFESYRGRVLHGLQMAKNNAINGLYYGVGSIVYAGVATALWCLSLFLLPLFVCLLQGKSCFSAWLLQYAAEYSAMVEAEEEAYRLELEQKRALNQAGETKEEP
jgi:hypothetical protein